ncbi:hypothetical protein BJX63DRAFT_392254 [Aspergillus granulosus]|uniref:Uncharacterized protein n=1 Tax=Aspergillus granulosus TaxID=176169 RepID=A0ABR4HG32_9EURO
MACGLHDADCIVMYQEEFKRNGGVAGPDLGNRRGVYIFLRDTFEFEANAFLQKAAPPSRPISRPSVRREVRTSVTGNLTVALSWRTRPGHESCPK